jgi:hypothetical protein
MIANFALGICASSFGVASMVLAGCSDPVPGRQPRTSALPPERVVTQSCPGKDCLIVQEHSDYCSLDPPQARPGAIFATKSRLNIRSGVYPVATWQGKGLTALAIRLTTPHGQAELLPVDSAYSLHKSEVDPESNVAPIEWIEVENRFRGDKIELERFFLRTSRWPHRQFYLGDPQDTRWFFEAGRNVYIRLGKPSSLFPDTDRETIFFAPCEMQGLQDETFAFAFQNGSTIKLTVRAINGSNEIGYYVGRLMSAEGTVGGAKIRVDDQDKLALFGSTRSWAETVIPSMAVRFPEQGDVCGFVFDTSQWDTGKAVNGYIAHEMTCNEQIGHPLALKSVSYPERFKLP